MYYCTEIALQIKSIKSSYKFIEQRIIFDAKFSLSISLDKKKFEWEGKTLLLVIEIGCHAVIVHIASISYSKKIEVYHFSTTTLSC